MRFSEAPNLSDAPLDARTPSTAFASPAIFLRAASIWAAFLVTSSVRTMSSVEVTLPIDQPLTRASMRASTNSAASSGQGSASNSVRVPPSTFRTMLR